MSKGKFVAIPLLFCALMGVSNARELGTHSRTWEVAEDDLRARIVEDAAKVDWEKERAKLRNQATSFTKRLPPHDLVFPDKDKVRWLDLSFVVDEDVMMPEPGPDGEYRWVARAKKGDRINPLAMGVTFPEALLFFDGRNEEQFNLVKRLSKTWGWRLQFIATGGDVQELTKKLKGESVVFYARTELLQKFDIQSVPSIVYPGTGKMAPYMAVHTFATPLSYRKVDDLLSSFFPADKKVLGSPVAKETRTPPKGD